MARANADDMARRAGDDHPTDRLVAWLDGALPAADGEAIEAHLAACASCRAERDALAAARARLAALPDEAPIRPVWPGVRARLRAAREPVFTPGFRIATGLAAAAAFVIVLVIGFGTRSTQTATTTDPLASLGSSLASSSSIAIADPGTGEASQ
jgi:anti-sigma factor RsiW